jgi:Predicted transcriptional regulator
MNDSFASRVSAIGCLDDPVRRSVYEAVTHHSEGVDRATLADELGLARSTAAFHLERLAEEGLVETFSQRLGDRSGPGSGRPTKRYRRSESETSVTIPDRRYDLAAELMARAIERTADTGDDIRASLGAVAHEAGALQGRAAGSLDRVLRQSGYEPVDDGEGGFALANCPFHRLAREHTDTVCSLNVSFLIGARDGSGDDDYAITPAAAGAPCCARIARGPSV